MLLDKNGNIQLNNLIQYPDNDYQLLREKAIKCTRCQLHETCQQVVMGKGTINNRIMFVGEGPGAQEDKKGIPFVGRAGRLLDKILEAVEITRDDIYITNIVKCRPPGNRAPTIKEARACSPILQAEIKLINPKVIVPLGSTALKYLIDQKMSITKMRGKWIKRGNIFILPTFHPAYLLRNSNMKKVVWRDFKLIKKSLLRIEELKEQA